MYVLMHVIVPFGAFAPWSYTSCCWLPRTKILNLKYCTVTHCLIVLLLAATRRTSLQHFPGTNNITTWILARNVNWAMVTHNWHTGGWGTWWRLRQLVINTTLTTISHHYSLWTTLLTSRLTLFNDLSATYMFQLIYWEVLLMWFHLLPDFSPGAP